MEITLNGSWTWVRSEGGFFGTTETPSSLGMTRSIEIELGNTLLAYINDTLSDAFKYTLVPAKGLWGFDYLLRWEGVWSYRDNAPLTGSYDQGIRLVGIDTLYLIDLGCDMYSHLYVRKKK